MEVKKDAFRLDLSSLDLHPVNEGDKEVSKEARYPNQLVHRRFHPMGVHKVPSLVPSRVDKEGPRMVRLQVKPQEDFRVSSAVSDLSGRTVRFRVPKPSSREDPKAQESLQCHLGQAEGFQSRSGRADRVSYVFVFGHPPRADVDDPVYRMDGRAHLCDCSSCQNISCFLSARSIEAFLRRQLLGTEGFILDSGARPGAYDRCFRLWLE